MGHSPPARRGGPMRSRRSARDRARSAAPLVPPDLGRGGLDRERSVVPRRARAIASHGSSASHPPAGRSRGDVGRARGRPRCRNRPAASARPASSASRRRPDMGSASTGQPRRAPSVRSARVAGGRTLPIVTTPRAPAYAATNARTWFSGSSSFEPDDAATTADRVVIASPCGTSGSSNAQFTWTGPIGAASAAETARRPASAHAPTSSSVAGTGGSMFART